MKSQGRLKQDTILQDEVLFSPRELQAAGGKSTLQDGQEGALFTAEGARKIVLRPKRADLRACDQFELALWIPQAARCTLALSIDLASKTEGIPERDRFWSGPRLPVRWSGWGKAHFPEENFLVYGIPDRWFPVESLTVSVDSSASEVILGSLRIQKRRRVCGPRLTDPGLFEELDLEALPAVRRALEAGKLDQAQRALLAHFERRKAPRHFYGQPPDDPSHFSPGAAEEICAHRILGQQLPRRIDWRANPIGYLEWMHAFNRHYFMTPLLDGYKVTRNEKYAAKLDELYFTWMEQNPEPQDTNGGGDPAWETLSTAVRIYGSWLEAWFTLQRSPSFRPETRLDMLKAFFAHAEHLANYQGGPNNWIIVESRVLALLGILFPEFRQAARWRKEGIERLTRELRRQVYPDGVQYEISPGYHSMSCLGFCDVYRLAKMNRMKLDSLYAERLEGMFNYGLQVSRPDGTWPSLNDSGGCRGRTNVAFLKLGAELFRRSDMAWVSSSGQRGRKPAARSWMFEDAGILVMRTGWERADRYLIFDAGPFSAAHQHEDKLSFELYANGNLFIADPGITSYMLEPWTYHYRSTAAHNTILIDGRGQNARKNETREQHIRSVRGENLWHSGRAFDFIRSEYSSGYAEIPDPVTHRRSVIFLKPDYWLVWDEILGALPHKVEAVYHFMPMRMQVDRPNGRIRTNRLGKPNLEMALVPRTDLLDISIVTGQADPVQGWIADGEDIPSPTVVIGRRQNLPFRFGVALIPYATGNSAGVSDKLLAHSAARSAFELTSRDGCRDIFIFRSSPRGEAQVSGVATDAEVAVLRRDGRGRIISALRVGGSFLNWRKRRILARPHQTIAEK